MSEIKKCLNCKSNLQPGHKNEKGIITFTISQATPANVWICELCWYEEPYLQEKQENNLKAV